MAEHLVMIVVAQDQKHIGDGDVRKEGSSNPISPEGTFNGIRGPAGETTISPLRTFESRSVDSSTHRKGPSGFELGSIRAFAVRRYSSHASNVSDLRLAARTIGDAVAAARAKIVIGERRKADIRATCATWVHS